MQYGVCGLFMVPLTAFASHARDTWIDRVVRAMGTLGVGLVMPSSVYSCAHPHLPQEQCAGRRWATRSYTFKGRDVYAPSGPRTNEAVRSLTDPANDLLHAGLPCHVPGPCSRALGRSVLGLPRRAFAPASCGGRAHHARPLVVNGPPSSVAIPAAQSADPSTSSPAAAQEGHQAHEAVRHGRCVCGRWLQGRRQEPGMPRDVHAIHPSSLTDVLAGGCI